MKPAFEPAALCAVAVAAALAACQGGRSAAAPAAPPIATTEEGASGPYVREASTEDYSVSIAIPLPARALAGTGERLVAEAEAEEADVARRAGERRREGASWFEPSTLTIVWSVAFDIPDAVSLLGETDLDEGGVRTETTRASVLYDRAAGREIGFADLFADPRPGGAAMTAVSEAAFAAWAAASPRVGDDLALVDERTLVDARDALSPRAASFATFTLTPAKDDPGKFAGVTLYYPEGVLGPREEGAYALFIPAGELVADLAPAWAARAALPVGPEQ